MGIIVQINIGSGNRNSIQLHSFTNQQVGELRLDTKRNC